MYPRRTLNKITYVQIIHNKLLATRVSYCVGRVHNMLTGSILCRQGTQNALRRAFCVWLKSILCMVAYCGSTQQSGACKRVPMQYTGIFTILQIFQMKIASFLLIFLSKTQIMGLVTYSRVIETAELVLFRRYQQHNVLEQNEKKHSNVLATDCM